MPAPLALAAMGTAAGTAAGTSAAITTLPILGAVSAGAGAAGAGAASGFDFSSFLSSINQKPLTPVVGGGMTLTGLIMNRKANKMMPRDTDPAMLTLLEDIRRRHKNFSKNAAVTDAIDQVRRNAAGMIDPLIRSGDPSLLLMGSAVATEVSNSGINQAIAQESQNEAAYLPIISQLTEKVSQRKFDMQMYRSLLKRAMAGRLIQGGLDNLNSA